jgi:hypothetical protein
MKIIETIHVVRAGLLYFAIVFAMGFLFGTVRLLLISPLIGAWSATLLELPVMLGVSYVVARVLVRKMRISKDMYSRLGMGAAALLFMLVAEFGLVVWFQRISVRDYLVAREPITGAAFYLSLLFFAAMPWLTSRSSQQ